MKKIRINNIEQEATLAKNVLDNSGNVLLKKGTTVSPALAKRLKNWGVMSICIEGDAEEGKSSDSSKPDAKTIQKELDAKFAGTLHNPIMKHILATVYRHRTQKIG